MRLFVAAWPPAEVRDALRSLPRPERPGVRWTPEEDWHVTLRFLGELPDPAPVVEVLRRELAGGPTRRATLAEATGVLGSVLVVGVDGLGPLATLVRLATFHLGDPPRPDPFAGHITVARAGRTGIGDELVGRPIPTGAGTTWTVDEIALVRSVIGAPSTGSSPRYQTLATIPLT